MKNGFRRPKVEKPVERLAAVLQVEMPRAGHSCSHGAEEEKIS